MTALVADTPAKVSAFRLISLKSMLKLESVGMKTRGGALRPRIAAEFGLKSRDPYSAFTAAINIKLDELHQQIVAG